MNLNTDPLKGSITVGMRDYHSWRECAVVVRAAGFSAEYVCSVREEELHHFLSQLETALSRLGQKCDIDFDTLERGITFRIRLDQRGHVRVNTSSRGIGGDRFCPARSLRTRRICMLGRRN